MGRLLPEEEGHKGHKRKRDTALRPGSSPASTPVRGAGQAWRKQPVSGMRLHL